ncbi:hypothetical protein [Plasmodium yoelii yoelii]|uniref:Uncharacterized protein n=1 Tax=Plasmodium yoelii yoelii TaxID=73239 RepID=Q7RBU6_PLAYO|nr:hypothetical protein [Plasmodium yoelii yoelii]
MAMVYNFFM